jgi:hypothetical protein
MISVRYWVPEAHCISLPTNIYVGAEIKSVGAFFTKIKFTFLKSVWKDLIPHSPYLKKKSFHLLEGAMNTVLFENLKIKNTRNRSIFRKRKQFLYKQVLDFFTALSRSYATRRNYEILSKSLVSNTYSYPISTPNPQLPSADTHKEPQTNELP